MVITIEVPESVCPPKFKLFDRVIHEGKETIVTGMAWYGPWSPLIPGWQYELDEVFNLWSHAGYPQVEDGEMVPENELKPVAINKGGKVNG
jgi:hypothetical protein